MKHEDQRRIIFDWAQGNYKSLKAVFVKEQIALGDHYHINKDEIFFLAVGEITEMILDKKVSVNITPPAVIYVPRNTYHKFICTPGTIIFGAATELFDPNDEIK